MELLSHHVLRALHFVQALNSAGIAPTTAEIDRYATTPEPRGAKWSGRFAAGLASAMEPDRIVREADPVADYCVEQGFLSAVANRATLTARGHAILAAVEDDANLSDRPAVEAVVLSPTNPWRSWELTTAFFKAGRGLFVDPYLDAADARWIISATEIQRLLIGSKNSSDFPALLAHLNELDRNVEVRRDTTGALHDRAILSASGAVTVLGYSINGRHKNIGLMVELPHLAVTAYVSALEDTWRRSEPVVAAGFGEIQG